MKREPHPCDDLPTGALVDWCHHGVALEQLKRPGRDRVDYIYANKPPREIPTRLAAFRPAKDQAWASSALAAYDAVVMSARVAHDAAARSARDAYDAAVMSACVAHDATARSARDAYDAAEMSALAAYDAVVKPACAAYNAVVKPARDARDAVMKPARVAYDAAVMSAGDARDAVVMSANDAHDAAVRSARAAIFDRLDEEYPGVPYSRATGELIFPEET